MKVYFASSPATFLRPMPLEAILLGPFLLGRFVLGPFVLGPFVLGPFVLGPFVLGPFVLGPFVLGPFLPGPRASRPPPKLRARRPRSRGIPVETCLPITRLPSTPTPPLFR